MIPHFSTVSDQPTVMRILIISPHFPPTNAADMQRVRLLLPYFREAGVQAEVLAVEPEQVAAPEDTWLQAGLPADVPVHRVKALGLEWGKIPGLGTLSCRALRAIRRKGEELLGREADRGDQTSGVGSQMSEVGDRMPGFDLVYFSTTQFGIHVLGPEWKRKFGVPFVMDYQDPWVNDYYREHPDIVPPGGPVKYGLASWMSRRQEPKVLRECAGITSVSAAYPEQLQARYPWLQIEEVFTAKAQRKQSVAEQEMEMGGLRSPSFGNRQPTTDNGQPTATFHSLPSLVLPFPGDERDLKRVRESEVRQAVFDPNDGKRHWVYIGRGGEDMALAVRGILAAISDLRPQIADVRIHFIGTSYAAAGRGAKTIEALAADYGLDQIVDEHPDRIRYSETLRCLLDADALIIPGSDDPGYTASKIYPYLLAERPLLAVFHEKSSVVDLIREVGGGHVIGFTSGESPETLGRRILESAIAPEGRIRRVPLDREAFAPHTARVQARLLREFFVGCLGSGSSLSPNP